LPLPEREHSVGGPDRRFESSLPSQTLVFELVHRLALDVGGEEQVERGPEREALDLAVRHTHLVNDSTVEQATRGGVVRGAAGSGD